MPAFPNHITVFTNSLSLSHISFRPAEQVVTLEGLYRNSVTGLAEDATLYCSFSLFRNLLAVSGNLKHPVAEKIFSTLDQPEEETDLMEWGGMMLEKGWFCLDPVHLFEDRFGVDPQPEFNIRGYIEKAVLEPAGYTPRNQQVLRDYYLSLLGVQWGFYRHFVEQGEDEDTALYYAGLQAPVVRELARLNYFDE